MIAKKIEMIHCVLWPVGNMASKLASVYMALGFFHNLITTL